MAGGGGGKQAGGGAAVTHQLPLPDKIVSGIIGKGGLVIKDIIHRSGAEIKVSQKDPNNVGGERVVSITGAPCGRRCRAVEAVSWLPCASSHRHPSTSHTRLPHSPAGIASHRMAR